MTSRSLAPTIPRGRQFGLALGVVLIDQISKAVMAHQLSNGRTLTAIPGLLNLHLVHNTLCHLPTNRAPHHKCEIARPSRKEKHRGAYYEAKSVLSPRPDKPSQNIRDSDVPV